MELHGEWRRIAGLIRMRFLFRAVLTLCGFPCAALQTSSRFVRGLVSFAGASGLAGILTCIFDHGPRWAKINQEPPLKVAKVSSSHYDARLSSMIFESRVTASPEDFRNEAACLVQVLQDTVPREPYLNLSHIIVLHMADRVGLIQRNGVKRLHRVDCRRFVLCKDRGL